MAISEATTLSLTMRPKVFEDVLGLDEAVLTLRSKLDKGEVPRGFFIKGPYGCGKCFGRGTRILLYDGRTKAVEDVQPGDMLMGPDSTPREVLSTTSGSAPLYDVVPNKGEPHRVNDAHVLVLRQSSPRRPELRDIPLSEYQKWPAWKQRCSTLYKTGVDFPERTDDLPVEPYFLGLWLGDGNTDDVRVTNGDPEIVTYLEEYATRLKLSLKARPNSPKSLILSITGAYAGGVGDSLQSRLRSLGVLGKKHIPQQYLTASRADRLQLLAGLIDSDGTRPRHSTTLSFSQVDTILLEQVCFLARSLGLWASINRLGEPTQYAGIGGNCDAVPVKIPRKMCGPRRQYKDPLAVGFSVKPAGVGEYFGFTLKGDGRFLLADFTITHNTTLAHIIARYIQGPLFDGDPCVQEKNSAYYRKLEDMRTLADSAGSYPMIGTYNVIILDECQQITKDAQQVLLKELEVPKSPTVWILCTTDPEKVNEGIRSRCFTIEVKAMDTEHRNQLVDRAAAKTGLAKNTDDLKEALAKAKVTSPRKILMAFETFSNGTAAEQAVAQMCLNVPPEYHEIAFAVCFGSWNRPSFNGGKPLGQLLKELDERLKKKPAPTEEGVEKEDAIEEDDLDTKSDAAVALRAVTGAFLKGQILPAYKGKELKYKEAVKSDRACRALQVLANFIPAEAFDLQWSGLMAALYRVNQIMQNGQ